MSQHIRYKSEWCVDRYEAIAVEIKKNRKIMASPVLDWMTEDLNAGKSSLLL